MKILVFAHELQLLDRALTATNQLLDRAGGRATVLLPMEIGEDIDTLLPNHQFPTTRLPRQQNKIDQVIAKIKADEYDLLVLAADGREPDTVSSPGMVHRIAQRCPVPCIIVRSVPETWDRALVCVRSPDQNERTIHKARELAAILDLDLTILNVVAQEDSKRESKKTFSTEYQANAIVRYGKVIPEIQQEISSQAYPVIIIGPHRASEKYVSTETTLTQPDFSGQIIDISPNIVVVTGRESSTPARVQAGTLPSDLTEIKRVIRYVAIELLIYTILVVGYAVIAFHLLVDPLKQFFEQNLTLYAIIALLLIVGQGTLLEAVTSFLLERLRLERFE